MNNFQRITASRETLAAFLGTIPAIETPWDDAFHRIYCSSCSAADCDDCRRPERDSPLGKTASLTEENVIALYGLLGDGYERNAVWCMNKATFFSDFFPLMNKSKNNVIEFANGKYYIMGAEVYFTGSLAAHEAYLGDFSYIIGNYSQDITVVRSEHSGLATNSIDYLGACVFDSKPVAGFGAFVHLAKAAA